MQKTLLAVLAAAVVAVGLSGTLAISAGTPANKVSAAGSAAEVVSPAENVTLLSERIRTSKPADLILGVTAECVITTELTTVGNDEQSASGVVRMWVTIDGNAVPVSSNDTTDPGKVGFCDREQERETTMFDDEDATIRTLDKAGQANGFNWMALNVGSGMHTVAVKADLTTEATDTASALAAVGKRTLIIEPTHAAHREDVTDLATP
jgi:hypothetical protein